MEEIWVDINGYEGYYQVSNLGRVKSLDRYILQSYKDIFYKRFCKGKILSFKRTNGNDYINLQLCKGYGTDYKNYYLHILVAEAFIPNPENKPTVNHIDGNKKNNCVDNLEWATVSEQAIHAYMNDLNNITEHAKGKAPKGSKCGASKLNEEEVKNIIDMIINRNLTDGEIADLFHVNRKTINSIRNKKTWKHLHKKII